MKELICIVCPRGCHLSIDDEMNVTGNTCSRGKEYAINELTCPKRVITSTVVIESSILSRLPVKTSNAIPKDLIFDCMKELDNVRVKAPIEIGEVIIKDILGTGVDVVATRSIEK